MTRKLLAINKVGLLMLTFLLSNLVSNAAVFTALVSGNWSNAATWGGGTPPSFINTGDQLIIPIGINVVMDNDVTLNGANAEVSVVGTLSSSTTNTFSVTQGIVTGTGTITADSMALGAGSALLFTGSVSANNLSTSAFSIQSSAALTVNNSLTLASGILSVQTGGSLALGANATIIVAGGSLSVNGGTLSLAANYNVTYTNASVVAGGELSGAGLQNVNINVGVFNTVTLSNDLTVNGTLTLTSGELILNGHNLTISGNVSATGSGTINSTSTSSININASNSIAGTLTFTGVNSAVNNFMLNVGSSNNVTIASNLAVTGILSLTTGVLNLSGANLTVTGNIAGSGTGKIASTSTSSINIITASSPSGMLQFVDGTNTVGTFTVDIAGGGSVLIASNLTIATNLIFIAGYLDIQNNILTMANAATITGAGTTAYVVTGVTGSLAIPLSVGALVSTLFPIGTSSAYFPAGVILNAGSTGATIQVGVSPNVYAMGNSGADITTTEAAVDATWNLHSDIVSNMNLNLQLMWSASSEVNGFLRTSSHISHYTGGDWDALGQSFDATVVMGSMYGLTRNNITSVSPFAVFDNSTETALSDINKNASFQLYPNPTSESINISTVNIFDEVATVNIYDVYGQLIITSKLNNNLSKIDVSALSKGNYFVKLSNTKINIVKTFTKM